MHKTSLQPFYKKNTIEAGCDEAGRGCLAGPVVAAAVILPSHFSHPLLNDSKKLSEAQRKLVQVEIKKNALAYGIALISPEKIDEINILNASILAMHHAIDQLKLVPQLLLIDGNRFKPYAKIKHICIVKGDAKYNSIAAASILAKTFRDEWMDNLHLNYPNYHWNKNKGYPTLMHRTTIKKLGITPQHRKTFRLLPKSQFPDS